MRSTVRNNTGDTRNEKLVLLDLLHQLTALIDGKLRFDVPIIVIAHRGESYSRSSLDFFAKLGKKAPKLGASAVIRPSLQKSYVLKANRIT